MPAFQFNKSVKAGLVGVYSSSMEVTDYETPEDAYHTSRSGRSSTNFLREEPMRINWNEAEDGNSTDCTPIRIYDTGRSDDLRLEQAGRGGAAHGR